MTLRSKLLLRLILASTILVGGTAWFGYQDVRYETRELFDAQLSRSARLILSLVQAQYGDSGFSNIQEYLDENGLSVMYIDFDEEVEDQHPDGHAYETKLAFQIWDDEGNLVVKSYNAPIEPMSSITEDYNDTVINGYNWRTFSLLSKNKQYLCITAERLDVRNDLIKKIIGDLFYLFIILIPTLALILFISIHQSLLSLQRLARQIDRRSGDNLDLITNENDYTEIATIKNALNQLLQRLKETLAREKRITSDAAHELRTPLAAIRLHTELAKNAKSKEQQDESLDQVISGVDRTTHMVEQLLALARLEPDLLTNKLSQVDISSLVVEESALLSPLALNKDIDISFNQNEVTNIKGDKSSLRLLIRNLLSNAIAYTPNGGTINILLEKNGPHTLLTIEDNGPGIAKNERERVLERFYRIENHQTPGCGIGLSIVARVVQLHHGELQLLHTDKNGGLKVVIQFN